MSDDLEPKRLELLDHLDSMLHYWLTVKDPGWSSRYPGNDTAARMDGLVFSILVMIDGGAPHGPYALRLLEDGKEGPDLSDHELHSRWAGRGKR